MAVIGTDAPASLGRSHFSWPVQLLAGLAGTAALVAVAYFFADRPVAFLVRDHGLNRCRFLHWLTRPPEAFVVLAPFVLLAGLLRRCFTPWTGVEKAAVAASVSTMLTALAALLLKVTFGRSSPELLLADGGAYGFYPFHVEPAYWALPSGHTACTLSVTAVAGVALPKWRIAWWSVAGVVAAALVALNYHFVGDVIAGAFLGWAVGGTVAGRFGIGRLSPPSQKAGPGPG